MLVSPTINNVHGHLLSITGTDPDANTEIIETVPARRRWLIRTFAFTLVTDVNVANRYIRIIIDDGTNPLFSFELNNVQSASKTFKYYFANMNIDETFVVNTLFHPIPVFILFPGCRIQTTTANFQDGDNYSAPQALIEEWIDP